MFEDVKRTVAFVSNYADDHGLHLPGRVPGFKREDIKLMPSSETTCSKPTEWLCMIQVCTWMDRGTQARKCTITI